MNNLISENFSKNKRGRPRIYPKEYLKLVRKISPNIKTDRGLIEFTLSAKAHKYIYKEYEKDKIKNSWAEYYVDPNHVYIYHKSILAALGRCNKECILGLGRLIAEDKIPATNAIKFIRKNRGFLNG